MAEAFQALRTPIVASQAAIWWPRATSTRACPGIRPETIAEFNESTVGALGFRLLASCTQGALVPWQNANWRRERKVGSSILWENC